MAGIVPKMDYTVLCPLGLRIIVINIGNRLHQTCCLLIKAIQAVFAIGTNYDKSRTHTACTHFGR